MILAVTLERKTADDVARLERQLAGHNDRGNALVLLTIANNAAPATLNWLARRKQILVPAVKNKS